MSNTIQSKTLATTPLDGTDILAIVQGGVLKRTTVGDLPEGATVIENANGIAIRFPTGIQICWTTSTITATADITTAAAGGFRSATTTAGTWTYPAAFDATPTVIPNGTGSNHLVMGVSSTGTTSTSVFAWHVSSTSSVTTAWRAIAIGSWSA